ncbi:MAG: hypothetical protein LJE94_17040 [Deltaproteobacteria bacterium]|nr:hypothetical protein [Deltaproteobacteria bacterium]
MQRAEIKQQKGMVPPPDCIWMQAGVVRKKSCKLDYRCRSCHFDTALQRIAAENAALSGQGRRPEGKRGNIVTWQQKLAKQPPGKRPCVHHMKKRIEFRTCIHDYHCSDCEFDQYFQDEFMVHAVVKPVATTNIQGFKIPQGYYLHRGHAWVKIEADSEVRMGLDDFALKLMGPPDAIVAPLVGKAITRDRGQIALNRGANTARMLSPVSGVVTAVNPRVRTDGAHAARNPYAEGWILRIHAPELREDLKDLMIGDESQKFLQDEVAQVYRAVEKVAGPLATDGGFLGSDIYGNLPALGWDNLAKTFLRS